MIAADHVEMVRINPGNFADKKKFAVHEYTDRDARMPGGAGDGVDPVRGVDGNRDRHPTRQRGYSLTLPRTDRLVGDQDVAAQIWRRLRLRDRGARQTRARSPRELASGNFRGLVGLEVRPQPAWAGGEILRHAADVPLHGGDVNHERGGWDPGDVYRTVVPIAHPTAPSRKRARRGPRPAQGVGARHALPSSSNRRDGVMPNPRILRYRLLRSMPSRSAVREMLPCWTASARRM